MKTRLSWFTEDEAAWESMAVRPFRPGRRRWLLLAFILVVLVVLLGIGYRTQARRIRAQEDAVSSEVESAFALWQQAVATGDSELFAHLLHNEAPQWQSGQKRLFNAHRLLGRTPLGLEVQSQPPTVTVDLASDWQSAELHAAYSYTSTFTVQPLVLEQTIYLQRQNKRWFIAPPGNDFWGKVKQYQGAWLTTTYPERDEDVVHMLAAALDQELATLCGAAGCPPAFHIRLHFDSDPSLLLTLRDVATPVFREGRYVLPAPSLVGRPAEAIAFEALYHGYLNRIVETERSNLAAPLPLPAQDLQLLCFPEGGHSPKLYLYEVQEDRWQQQLSDGSFRFLMPVPNDEGVLLRAFTRGRDATRLRLLHWWRGKETVLFDEEYPEQLTRPAAWSGAVEEPRLLLHNVNSAQLTEYHLLDLTRCGAGGCELNELEGYTVWSPDGASTLVMHDQRLWRGDANGLPQTLLGRGANPFWLADGRYGFIRYATASPATDAALVVADPATDRPSVWFHNSDLVRQLNPDDPPLFVISHVVPASRNGNVLLLAGTAIGAVDGKYNIFAYDGKSDIVSLLWQSDRAPSGFPSLLTPAGYPPFQLSPDGRWLLLTQLMEANPTTWRFVLVDVATGQQTHFDAYYPSYPAVFPFYDWSYDGQWLAIVDDGFLRLIAPAYDYQRLVTHGQDDCLFTAWVNE